MKETLLYLRDLNHYSQSFVANYLNISRQMYSKYENGDVEPGVKSVISLCKLYKVPYETILENKLKSFENKSITYKIKEDFNYDFSSPTPSYSSSLSNNNSGFYYQKILSLLPKLVYAEELDLLARLAHKVEVHTQKTKIEAFGNQLSEKEAENLFEYFSGKGKDLDFETEKSKYLAEKNNLEDLNGSID